MQQLYKIISDTENILSNPQKVVESESNTDGFDFTKLIQSFGQKLPEGFDFGVFTARSNDEIEIPVFLPFEASNGICIGVGNASDFTSFNELLEKSIFGILSALQYNAFKLTLIDGKNHGINLSNLSQFDSVITGGKIYKENFEITKALNEVLQKEINVFQFIVINNFPNGFSPESATILIKILNQAKEKRIRVLMTKELEITKFLSDLDAAISEKLEVINFDKDNHWFSNTFERIDKIKELFILHFGSSYSESDMQSDIATVNLMYESAQNLENEVFDINEGIKIPVGVFNKKAFYFRFGHGASNYHAIVAGRSGKGKTVFLDNIIARATNIYSPDELRFVLLDMKGIEFNEYKNLPHVHAFCSSSNIDNGMKIVEFLQNNLKERESLFNSVEASNIVDYKIKAGKMMPRLLVIIDEFQNLFTGNYKTDNIVEEILIKQILRLGRAYGVHLICCTQSLGDGVRSSFLNNIPLRIAFQMTQDQSRSFLANNNTAAEALKVGEAIYNEQDGIIGENKLVQIDHLKTVDIHKLIADFIEKGKSYQSFERLIIKK